MIQPDDVQRHSTSILEVVWRVTPISGVVLCSHGYWDSPGPSRAHFVRWPSAKSPLHTWYIAEPNEYPWTPIVNLLALTTLLQRAADV